MYQLRQNGSPEVTDELYSLASGPHFHVSSYSACIVNGTRFVTHTRDSKRLTQNSSISVPGTNEIIFYGYLEEIQEFNYMDTYSVVLFKCKWFDINLRKKKIKVEKNITSIAINSEWYKDEPYILASQAK